MERKKILIAVKTYPHLSEYYDELVCTAGVEEDGSWVRLYPVPFRSMDYGKQYTKYQWIEVDVRKRMEDRRPESYVPRVDTLYAGAKMPTTNNWQERKSYILREIHDDMATLIKRAYNNELSIAVFKATVTNFYHRKVSGDKYLKYQKKLNRILHNRKQMKLPDDSMNDITPVSIPDYQFYYKFIDAHDKVCNMMIEDWEIQALYRNCLSRKSETDALSDVREKYWNEFVGTKNLYLFLGTTLEHHNKKASNPFTIIGTFTPNREDTRQQTLFSTR